jgi:hypothetical protein
MIVHGLLLNKKNAFKKLPIKISEKTIAFL